MISKAAVTRSCCHKTLRFLGMASSNTNFSSTSNEQNREMSLRANKRKRAREHYKKRHGKTMASEPVRENETVYYIDNGLRKVYPYYFNFSTYSKGRWIGRTILNVFAEEFAKTGEKHKELIENGKITVNGKKVPTDFILGENMFLEHKTHRHEMPVLNEPIEIIVDTDEILVINKPASIPVHPCGRYRENSITQMLKLHFGYDHLRILYRLDRLTSGLLIMPKTTKLSKKLESQLERRLLHKQYVCRVIGKFPDGELECNESLGCLSQKLSIYRVDDKNGKASSTTFTRLSYNGRTSVVKCVPHTGRTHQIRLHLQWLGYPICNDPLYNSLAFGPSKGKGGVIEKTLEEIEADILNSSNVGRWVKGHNPRYIAKFGENKTVTDSEIIEEQQPATGVDSELEKPNEEMEHLTNSLDTQGVNVRSTEVQKPEVPETSVEKACNSSTVYSNCSDNEKEDTELEIPSKRLKITGACGQNSDLSQDIKGGKEITETSNVIEKVTESSQRPNEFESEIKEDCIEQREMNTDVGKESEMNKDTSAKLGINEDSEEKDMDVKVLNKSFIIRDVAKANTDTEYDECKDTLDEDCEDCKHINQDPDRTDLMIYLHAVSYKGPDWEYSTTLPYWASEDFDERTDMKTILK